MRTKSAEYEENRLNEILNACDALYAQKGFHDITLKDISEKTSFSRPSIYNYFQTKEEIFLGLLLRELKAWISSLKEISFGETKSAKEELASKIASTLSNRTTFLKILATNIYEIEENSRLERLAQYKTAYKEAFSVFTNIIEESASCTKESPEAVTRLFFPFLSGVYPYAFPTQKQKDAMTAAEFEYVPPTVETLAKEFLLRVL